ncbi:MAG: hypothetical protein RLZZ436_863 [Planctomycetota bacterium]|jgi:hypothetical protein
MLELIVLGMGVYGLCSGKFTASKGRVLTGLWARICSLILLLHLPNVFIGQLILAEYGLQDHSWAPILVSLASLLCVIALSATVARRCPAGLNPSVAAESASVPEIVEVPTAAEGPSAEDHLSRTPTAVNDPVLKQIARPLVLLGGILTTCFAAAITVELGEAIPIGLVIFGVTSTMFLYRSLKPQAQVVPSPEETLVAAGNA